MPNNQAKCFSGVTGHGMRFIMAKKLNENLPSGCVVDLGYEKGEFIIKVNSYPHRRLIRIPAHMVILDDERFYIAEGKMEGPLR